MPIHDPNSLFFIGIDGGASKCHVRIEDAAGNVLGEKTSGPANIRLSIHEAWKAIYEGIEQILTPLGLQLNDKDKAFYAGMGLAGLEVIEAYNNFCKSTHPFREMAVTSDSHTACLGAHAGGNGAIIIAGTGVVGLQIENSIVNKVGGWGFPHDDEGGGAWLGLQAVRVTLQWLDKRLAKSSLAEAIYTHFNQDANALVHWAHAANSTRFATLAPFVIEHSQTDLVARQLIEQAASSINKISDTLISLQKNTHDLLPCALIGGVTQFLLPYFNAALHERLIVAKTSPAAGAIQFIKNHIAAQEEIYARK